MNDESNLTMTNVLLVSLDLVAKTCKEIAITILQGQTYTKRERACSVVRMNWISDELDVPCVELEWHGEDVFILVGQRRACDVADTIEKIRKCSGNCASCLLAGLASIQSSS